MKKQIIVSFWICIFLCVPFLSNSQSNTIYVKKADSLFGIKNYNRALINYEKALFFNHNLSLNEKNTIYYKKAKCYKNQQDYIAAKNELINIKTLKNTPDSLLFIKFFEKAVCGYMLSQYSYAEMQLIQLNYYIKDTNYLQQTYLLNSLVYINMQDFDTARWFTEKYIASLSINKNKKQALLQYIDSLFTYELPRIKDVEKAKKLSQFVPGAGQLYLGRYKEGLLSITFLAATLSFGIWQVIDKFYVTGYFFGFGLLQRFYFGGIKSAGEFAEIYNYKELKRFLDAYNQLFKSF